jgi:hypothetical protein
MRFGHKLKAKSQAAKERVEVVNRSKREALVAAKEEAAVEALEQLKVKHGLGKWFAWARKRRKVGVSSAAVSRRLEKALARRALHAWTLAMMRKVMLQEKHINTKTNNTNTYVKIN